MINWPAGSYILMGHFVSLSNCVYMKIMSIIISLQLCVDATMAIFHEIFYKSLANKNLSLTLSLM